MASRKAPAAKKPHQRRKDARPDEIVAAALELFVEHGFSATTLEKVAAHAGVSKGTLYLYFENKEALFRAVVKEVVVPELERAEQTVAAHAGSAESLLRRLVHDWWTIVGETRLCGIPKLMMAEAGNFPELARFFVNEVVARARRLFAQIIIGGVRDGEFRDCDPEYAARVLMAPMIFAAVWEHSLRPFDAAAYDVSTYLETHLDAFFGGLLRREKE